MYVVFVVSVCVCVGLSGVCLCGVFVLGVCGVFVVWCVCVWRICSVVSVCEVCVC